MDMSEVRELQTWFLSHCDEDWEHGDGITIETLDNPGWTVTINLDGTEVEGNTFRNVEDNYDHDTDWLRCWREHSTFRGVCGPSRLADVLRIFLDWAGPSNKPMQTDGPPGRR